MKKKELEKEKKLLRLSCNYFIVRQFIKFMYLCGSCKPTQPLIRGFCNMIDAGFFVFNNMNLKYVLEQLLDERYTESYVRTILLEEGYYEE